MEMRWILLGKKHVGQSFKGFLVGFWDGAHQIEGFFCARNICETRPEGEGEAVNHRKIDMIGMSSAPVAECGQDLTYGIPVLSA